MKIPSREQIEELRRIYPVGATVELIDMDDYQAPPAGTLGEVFGVGGGCSLPQSIGRITGICQALYQGLRRF